MHAKIEWYKEVLELEPASRVFLPLAKMLIESGQPDEAIATLQHGLERHPDHVEARLLLVELLHTENTADRSQELDRELDTLMALLSAHPGFWSAWAEKMEKTPQTGDTSLILSFLSCALQKKQLSLRDVLISGLKAMQNTDTLHRPERTLTEKTTQSTDDQLKNMELPRDPVPYQDVAMPFVTAGTADVQKMNLPQQTEQKQAAPQSEEPDPEENMVSPEEQGTAPTATHPLEAVIEHDTEHSSHVEINAPYPVPECSIETHVFIDQEPEQCTLQTRSMAEVLAEQGDLEGARLIFEELLAQAENEDEKLLLQEGLARLSPRAVPVAAPEVHPEPLSQQNTQKLVGMLEMLASRLEARVTQ